jgi:hypothetical protein
MVGGRCPLATVCIPECRSCSEGVLDFGINLHENTGPRLLNGHILQQRVSILGCPRVPTFGTSMLQLTLLEHQASI